MRKIDLFLIFLLNFLWAGAFAFAGYAMFFISPIFLYALRFALAGFSTCWFYKLKKEEFWKIFLLATLQTIIFCGIALSIKNLDSSTTAILNRLDVIFTIIFGIFIFHEKLKLNLIIGILLCFAGIYVISGNISFENFQYAILLIMSCIFSGLANILIKYIKNMSNFAITSWTSIIMSMQLFIIAFFAEEQFILQNLNWQAVLIIIYLSFISTYLCYAIFYHLLKNLKTVQTMPYQFLRLVFSMFFSWIILNEQITIKKIIAATLILLGVSITQIDFKNKTN